MKKCLCHPHMDDKFVGLANSYQNPFSTISASQKLNFIHNRNSHNFRAFAFLIIPSPPMLNLYHKPIFTSQIMGLGKIKS